MKLRNRKTGEIGTLEVVAPRRGVADEAIVFDEIGGDILGRASSIAELNAEWKDYEEPKLHWYIYGAEPFEVDEQNMDKDYVAELKSIGNYFNTREEAEKAVEKLKAAKRLKDKGFSFHGYDDGYDHDFNSGHIEFYVKNSGDVLDDLDLLFGGEE